MIDVGRVERVEPDPDGATVALEEARGHSSSAEKIAVSEFGSGLARLLV
jgi:hypothetical protein